MVRTVLRVVKQFISAAYLLILLFVLPSFGSDSYCKNWYRSADLIKTYRSQINTFAQQVPSDVNPSFFSTEWSCRTGNCMALSAQLYAALSGVQLPVSRVAVSTLYIMNVPADLPSGVFHFFVVDKSIRSMEIIIDSTYKQFFIKDIPEPDVFIGTRADLEALFARYHSLIKLQDGADPMGKDPKGVAEVYYGYGRGETTKYGKAARE